MQQSDFVSVDVRKHRSNSPGFHADSSADPPAAPRPHRPHRPHRTRPAGLILGCLVSSPREAPCAQFGVLLPLTFFRPRRKWSSHRASSTCLGRHLRTMSNPASFESNRRSAVFGRTPEELHIPSTGLINPNLSRQPPSQDYPTTPNEGAAAQVPLINVHSSLPLQQQQQPQPQQYGGSGGNSNNAVPGSLTPGNQHRPSAVSVNTAPSVIPTLPQQSTPTSHRTSMINSHGHSRSSPAGFDQSTYKQYGGLDGPKYPTSPGGYAPQTPQGSKYSPLGLADIRPPGDHLLGDALMSPSSSLPYNGETQIPTNSNYVAPWPIYAVDWCKWPMTGSSSSFGGKLALGSYLEDNHNYVRPPFRCSSLSDKH